MGLTVITGASSGIGAVYADCLARRGYDLLLVARNTGTSPHRFDVLDQRATAPLLSSDIAKMSEMITLNAEVLTRLIYAAAPAFVKRGSGTIINIVSIVAVVPELLNSVYGGTKAFVLAFSQSLRRELANTGVKIQVVLPGATATNFWNTAGKPVEHVPQEIVMSTQDMVDAALAGFDQGEFVTIPSLPDAGQWQSYEAARRGLMPNLSRAEPAGRYGLVRAAA